MVSTLISDRVSEMFVERFDAGDPSLCWEWKGSRDLENYGRLKLKGKYVKAHRYAFAFFGLGDPGGMCVLHRCDNPPCVNPAHLFLGTNLDNIRDRHRKGRDAKGGRNASRKYPLIHAGEKHGRHKLSDQQVISIRVAYSGGLWTQDALAKLFSVSQTLIGFIVRKVAWRHLP